MIFFECYADESMLRYLGFAVSKLKGGHSFGRSNVSKKLFKETQSMGLIDEDPGRAQDPYLKYLFSLNPVYTDQYMICMVDNIRKNKIIALRPDLEGFTLRLAKDRKIDLKGYALPNDAHALHDVLTLQKNPEKRKKKLIQFFTDNSDHRAILKLKDLVKN